MILIAQSWEQLFTVIQASADAKKEDPSAEVK